MKKANTILWRFMKVCANRRNKDARHLHGSGGTYGTGKQTAVGKRNRLKAMTAEERKAQEEKDRIEKERAERDKEEVEAEQRVLDFHDWMINMINCKIKSPV